MSESLALARAAAEEISRLRRDFHRHPELSFEEERTVERIATYLEELGLPIVRPEGMHGMWADYRVEGAEKTILLRADMDALPMQETTGGRKNGYASETPGVAHCCGHDAHMAMLMAAARLLAEGKATARHNVRFLFQHAEETPPGGAGQLIEAGCLEGVDEVYGLHVFTILPSGLFSVLAGPLMAAADSLRIVVRGSGGHAAIPHRTLDPIPAACQVVTALQHLISRRRDPLNPAVLTISSIHSQSHTHNVISDEVELLGTVRNLDREFRDQLEQMIGETSKHAAEALGCTAEVTYERGYDVLINDARATERGARAIEEVAGARALIPDPVPIMGGEDFSKYAELRPACFVFLGVRSEEQGIVSPNHHAEFDVDEDVLPLGTAWFLELARGR